MKKTGITLGILLLSILSFWIGGLWNQFQYDDWCLDMGGGKNPGGHKYCVVGDISNNENFTKDFVVNRNNWVDATGIITEGAQMPDGTYAYTIQYDVVDGEVINTEGELIEGPLSQHIFNVKGIALEGQQIKLRYDPKEPIFYELLEDIKFTED